MFENFQTPTLWEILHVLLTICLQMNLIKMCDWQFQLLKLKDFSRSQSQAVTYTRESGHISETVSHGDIIYYRLLIRSDIANGSRAFPVAAAQVWNGLP